MAPGSLLKFALLFTITAFLKACEDADQRSLNFYYWKTNYKLSNYETEYLRKNSVKKIYLRCFDVVIENNKAVPQGVMLWQDSLQKNMTYIPTVFIRNEIFRNADTAVLRTLSRQVLQLCAEIMGSKNIALTEIQIDCDWTKNTSEAYFFFLQCIKSKNLIVSNTLRLYQYKYRETAGIAPVDYATLMCYNMGNMKDEKSENSILNTKDLEAYLKGAQAYPKPINIALPLFRWVLLYHDHAFKGILYKSPDVNSENWRQLSPSQYLCVQNYYDLQCEREFYIDETIRIEEMSAQQRKEAEALIKKYVKNTKNEIIYFDLDSSKISHMLY